MRTLVWFRGKDLRIHDHAPLRAAIAEGEVIPLFVLDPYFFAPERARELPHRMQYLLDSLRVLAEQFAARGAELVTVAGKSTRLIPQLARSWQVDRVVAYRWSEPVGRERDRRVAAALHVPLELFEGETLAAPGEVRTKSGEPFRVYTPFARALAAQVAIEAALEGPLAAPRTIPRLPPRLAIPRAPIPKLAELGITRNDRLLPGGEEAARDRLRHFVKHVGADYHETRDLLAEAGTSRLSQDLKFGVLSVRTAWHAVANLPATPRDKFRAELYWREFTYDLLRERPTLLEQPFDARFETFPWRDTRAEGWPEWVSGHTGYPVIDAAARQLQLEGFVHNRARMISASFLTKHLLVHYRHGEAHYMKWLTDADWANNNAGWQWSAGCGCDAQPYFRVFNPILQGERFDPEGAYVRRYVPELAALPAKYIHAPWTAPADVLARARVQLGTTYPRPIVDHDMARTRFLETASAHLKRAA